MIKKKNKNVAAYDRKLLLTTITLGVMGVVAIADASAPQAINTFADRFYFARQQGIWLIIGFVALVVASRIPYKLWEKLALPLFAISLILLIMVLVPGLGVKTMGARRWLMIAGQSFQPTEFVKMTLSMYFAKLADAQKSTLAFVLPLSLVAILVISQPDMGTLIIITAIGASQMFVSGVNLLQFFGFGVFGLILGSLAIITSDYRKARLLTYIQSTNDPLGSGYHIRQVLLGLGLGGLFGVGLGESRQKYLFLPEAATDSIFAVIAEEIGFLGSVVIILAFVFLIYRIFKIALSIDEIFPKVLCMGLGMWIGAQALLNLGAMTALVPLTGIPLPLFSYGGTSLVMILFSIGIVLGISKQAKINNKPSRFK